MLGRERIEKQEDGQLAPYALRSRDTRGRLFSEVPHSYRTEYQRDRDRVLHSRAFRRLQYKTQVLPFPGGDHFRNRLTHTLEVSQIARTVARALGANEDLTEAIVLAHDMGHPPFGHAGEHVLHDLAREQGGFEHNRQSLRIVDWIEVRSDRYAGLNLTFEARSGLLKHGTSFPRYSHPVPLPEIDRHASLEAQIANLADELAYHTHDIDDGLRAGLLDWERLSELSLWRRALACAEEEGARDRRVLRTRATVSLIDILATDLIETTSAELEDCEIRTPEEVRVCERPLVGFSSAVRKETRDAARHLTEHFYRHPKVIEMADRAGGILRGLWSAYGSEPERLPFQVRERIGQEPIERAIADYISGMTDRFALDEYRKLHGSG
ncbi:MAG: deoxyguanosinetriphosphate triphosphohydrolase [bacterium]|nr:deoxyguanosinetriphosphate triphosphohydrolase [bacterium]